MSSSIVVRILRLLSLVLAQVVVFNNMHLYGCITPLVIGYMLLSFSRDTSRVSLLLWGFAAGLIHDMFANTAGMAAASMTLVAMMRTQVMEMLVPRDASEDFVPTVATMGAGRYFLYATLVMTVMHTCYIMLNTLSFTRFHFTLISIAGSALLSALLCTLIDIIAHPKRHTR